MKKYVLVVAVAAALFSCSGNPKADATQTDKNKQETAQVPDMHNAETSLDYWGVYEGTLPAASSPGIKTTLTLNKDKTFTLRSEYIDEKDGILMIRELTRWTVTSWRRNKKGETSRIIR